MFAGPEGVSNGKGGLKHLPGEFIAFLEIKKRRKVAASWPSTIVHINKHHAARWGKKYFKVPTVCLVLFTDTAGYFNLHELPDSEEDIERWDRPGQSVPHACYLYSRMTWDTELLPAVMAAIAADEGEDTTEN